MVNINLTMQMDDSLQLFVDDLEDVDSNGMNLILGRVRRDIIDSFSKDMEVNHKIKVMVLLYRLQGI